MEEASVALDLHVPEEERPILEPILSGAILEASEEDIESSGYVVHTLGASLWCCGRNGDYRGAVLEAINLGYDADTTGAVVGGLAGVMHETDAMPNEWVEALRAGGQGEWGRDEVCRCGCRQVRKLRSGAVRSIEDIIDP